MKIHAATLIAGSMLAGCGTDQMKWTEEVQQDDKQVLEVLRSSERATNGFPNSNRGPVIWERLDYAPARVTWRSDRPVDEPVSFQIIDGVPYLVALPAVRQEDFCQGKTKGVPVAKVYRWVGGRQESVDPGVAPIDRMRLNLSGLNHWSSSSKRDRTRLSIADVQRINHQLETVPLVSLFERSWLRCD